MFDNLFTHGFVRVAVCVPRLRVADPRASAAETLRLAGLAHAERAALALFPELGISAYTNDELFFQNALLEEVNAQLVCIVERAANCGRC
jgi:NAD+ synthase (glutamine-hydrolysing)